MHRVLVTGAAGFIGSAVVRHLIRSTPAEILNVDKMTYVSSLTSLEECRLDPRHQLLELDLADRAAITAAVQDFQPSAIMHLAAQSHVDYSIRNPGEFVESNIVGTFNLLEACRSYWEGMSAAKGDNFRFLHVSTDEVFGDLPADGDPFSEQTAYQPSSPYSASKAAADHLVRAWQRTYNFPALVTNCSNNYGPYQYPEKLIPVVVDCALKEQPLPIYGDGQQRRDWLHVDDHVSALMRVLSAGKIGSTYNIGGLSERANLEVVKIICGALDKLVPRSPDGQSTYADLMTFVEDRPGHDRRYAIDCSKISSELGWTPQIEVSEGLRSTVAWYVANQSWCKTMLAQKPDNTHWLKQ